MEGVHAQVSDEAVEAAARAFHAVVHSHTPHPDNLWNHEDAETIRFLYRKRSRAALEAAEPLMHAELRAENGPEALKHTLILWRCTRGHLTVGLPGFSLIGGCPSRSGVGRCRRTVRQVTGWVVCPPECAALDTGRDDE